ncbi:MAG: PAS domain S-box protein [Candidatus Thorarchaeota archaeon]
MPKRQSKKLLERVFESLDSAIFVLDSEIPPKILDCNSAATTIFGYSKSEMLGHTTEFLHISPAKLGEFQNEMFPLIEKHGSFSSFEFEMKRKDGEIFPTDHTVQPIMDENNCRIGWVSVIRDISRQKRAEQALILEEERLRALLNLNEMEGLSERELADFALEEVVRLTGSKVGYLHFVNPDQNTIQLYIWSQATLKECTAEKTAHYPLEQAGVWADCVRRRKPVIHNDYQNLPDKKGYPEGHFHVLSHMSVPIFDGSKIVAIAGVGNKEGPYEENDVRQLSLFMNSMWGILKRKRTEQELMKLVEFQEAILANSFDGIAVTNLDGEILYANPILCDLSKYSEEELLESPLAKITLGSQFVSHLIRSCSGQKNIVNLETDLVPQFGEAVPVALSAAMIKGSEQILVSMRDLQTEHELSQELARFRTFAENYIRITLFKMGARGPEPIISEVQEDQQSSLIRLGVFYAAALGQGSSAHLGLFGPLPFPLSDHIGLAYSFLMHDPLSEDPRGQGQSYCFFVFSMPEGLERLFINRVAVGAFIKKELAKIANIQEIDLRFLETLKQQLLNPEYQNPDIFSS